MALLSMPLPVVALPCRVRSRSTASASAGGGKQDAARLTAVVVFPTPPF